MDDATSEIYSAFLVEQEGTMSSFQGLGEVIERHGLCCSLYADKASHYWLTTTAGKRDRDNPTQVKRALDQLGIELIAADSPQARGRSERMFGTLQDRLPKELRLAEITAMEPANRYIAETFLPRHNARFAVKPAQPGSAFVPDRGRAFADILCVQEERTVGNDNTVRYHRLVLQLPQSPLRPHFVRATVRVHHYPDGTLAVFHGPRCLARYTTEGALIDPAQTRPPKTAWRPLPCGDADDPRAADRLRFPRVPQHRARHVEAGAPNTGKCSPSPTSPQGPQPKKRSIHVL
jgi:hypothetical protein